MVMHVTYLAQSLAYSKCFLNAGYYYLAGGKNEQDLSPLELLSIQWYVRHACREMTGQWDPCYSRLEEMSVDFTQGANRCLVVITTPFSAA